MRNQRLPATIAMMAMLSSLTGCIPPGDSAREYGPPPQQDYYAREAAPPPPTYDPSRTYSEYQGDDRALSRDDRVYRGKDGRYYCKRSNGSTGLVVGAGVGSIMGAILGGGGLIGILIGAGAGGLLGKSVDKGEVRCK